MAGWTENEERMNGEVKILSNVLKYTFLFVASVAMLLFFGLIALEFLKRNKQGW